MNLKRFILLCALLAPPTALMAAPDTNSPAGPPMAQATSSAFPTPPATGGVPIPPRRVTPNPRRPSTQTNSPVSNTTAAAARAARAAAIAAAQAAFPTLPTDSSPAPAAKTPPASTSAADFSAPTAPGSEGADIEYNLPGIPIDQLLDTVYAPLVGRTLLRASQGPESITGTATITLKTQTKLTKKEAITALETVLGMNGVTIVPLGDKFAKVITEATAGQAGGLVTTNSSTNMPLAGKFITQIVQLKYANGQDLTDLLKNFAKGQGSIIYIQSTQTLILRDYAENVARMMEMVERIDVVSPLQVKPEIIPIKYALASDMAQALSALGASGGTSVGKSTSGASFQSRGGGSSSAFGGGGGSGGYGNSSFGQQGGGYGGGYPGQSVGLQSESIRPFSDDTFSPMAANPTATAARSSFQQNLSRIVQGANGAGQFTLFGQTKIIADERSNSLLVFANDDDMKMIHDIINKLDVVLPQVLIEAIILEINLTGTRNTGVSYLAQKKTIGQFSGAGGLNNLSSGASGFLSGTNGGSGSGGAAALASLPGGFSYFANYGNDLNVVLEAIAGDARINVLSRPRIQTSHAVPADLFIGNTVPYVTGTYNYGYGSGPSSQYTEKEVGIRLQVLPLINPEGLVEMDIQTDIEELGPDVQIAGVGGVPTTTKRQAGAKVAVRDGETILLGGFISDSRSKSDSGIPWLKDIPGLGILFRSSSMQNLRTELVVMLRPTVLPTPAVAAQVATAERNKLSGVKQAELEIRTDERERNAKIDEQLAREAARRARDQQEQNGNAATGATNAPARGD